MLLVGLIGVLGVGGWWWFSTQNSAPSETNSSRPATSPRKTETTAAASSADADLKRLQRRVTNARPSDSEILTSINDAEEKYPADYRFTYERAKLFGKGLISHVEAWNALREAAAKAIDNDQADEMLNDLKAKADADFRRLSRGHDEWTAIIQALETGDKEALKHGGH